MVSYSAQIFYILLQSILLDVISITRILTETENQSKETFQARIIKLIHTKHDINP